MRAAYDAAARRFTGLLDELCEELAELRQAADPARCPLKGVVARRMHAAVAPFAADHFITPMAAVAGCVAEEILGAMLAAAPLERAYVNNGGDIALHLTGGEQFSVGLMDRPDRYGVMRTMTVDADDPVARHRDQRPPWPQLFARHCRCRHRAGADRRRRPMPPPPSSPMPSICPAIPRFIRCPANELQPDSDLGARLVTRDVGALTESEIEEALGAGARRARQLLAAGLIEGAALRLLGETVVVGATGSGARCMPFTEAR